MKKYKEYLCVILMSILPAFSVAAQNSAPIPLQIGKPMPDFTLTNIRNFETKTARLRDFKGKWLFMDFWNLRCTSCVRSFGKVNGFHEKFKDRLNWILVGLNDKRFNSGIEKFYDRFSRVKNLTIPVAFDSVLKIPFDVSSMPHILMIDPTGVLYGISNGADITAEKLQKLFDGKPVKFNFKNSSRPDFEPVVRIDSAREHELLSFSMLSKWNGQQQNATSEITDNLVISQNGIAELKQIMLPLFALYDLAYFGNWDWDHLDSLNNSTIRFPVLELKDSSAFDYSYSADFGKGMYNYYDRGTVKRTRSEYMKLLQGELKRCFGYDARVERRQMPVWRFESLENAESKLRSKGGPHVYDDGNSAAGFSVRNLPIHLVLSEISTLVKGEHAVPFIDGTGITYPVDFSIVADMTDIPSIQKALKEKGLRLVKTKQEMRVVVIRDAQNQ